MKIYDIVAIATPTYINTHLHRLRGGRYGNATYTYTTTWNGGTGFYDNTNHNTENGKDMAIVQHEDILLHYN